MNKNNLTDDLFQQFTAISKASAYDAIAPEYSRLQAENAELKHKVAELSILLKGSQDMVKALKEFVNDVRPKDATVIELGGNSDPDDLKQVNI